MSDAKAVETIEAGADEFWMEVLRPILLIGIVLGILAVIFGLLSLTRLNESIFLTKRAGRPWLTSQVFFGYAIQVGVPLSLFIGATRALKRKSNARLILLIYAWISLGLMAYSIGMSLWNMVRIWQASFFLSVVYSFTNAVWQAAYPAILLILLMKKPIAELFQQRDVAFEVMPPPSTE